MPVPWEPRRPAELATRKPDLAFSPIAPEEPGTIPRPVSATRAEFATLEKETVEVDPEVSESILRKPPRPGDWMRQATATAATDGGVSEGEIGVYSFTTTEVTGHIERPATARSVRDE